MQMELIVGNVKIVTLLLCRILACIEQHRLSIEQQVTQITAVRLDCDFVFPHQLPYSSLAFRKSGHSLFLEIGCWFHCELLMHWAVSSSVCRYQVALCNHFIPVV